MKYNTPVALKSHYFVTALLTIVAVGGMLLAYNQVDAATTEVIEIDLEQQVQAAAVTTDSAEQLAAKTQDANQTQFMYLVGLASVGLLGIAGVVRDVHKDRA